MPTETASNRSQRIERNVQTLRSAKQPSERLERFAEARHLRPAECDLCESECNGWRLRMSDSCPVGTNEDLKSQVSSRQIQAPMLAGSVSHDPEPAAIPEEEPLASSPPLFGRQLLLDLVRGDSRWFERRGIVLEQHRITWTPGSPPVGFQLSALETEARSTGRQALDFPFSADELIEMSQGCNDILSGWIGEAGRAIELRLRVAAENFPQVISLVRSVEDALARQRAVALIGSVDQLGLDRRALVKSRFRRGPRGAIRRRLVGKHPFETIAPFNYTWQRLIDDGTLVECDGSVGDEFGEIETRIPR
jgi:hypothetical protein